MYGVFGKKTLDLTLLILLSPVWVPVSLLVGLLLRLTQGEGVLFRQTRPGKQGRLFTMFKFRTMTPISSRRDEMTPDQDRLTEVGRVLRRTSLDELPELVNVLRGDMSLVGPRPLLPQYLERYSPEQARRHEVRPGLTGWAQVNGRNALTWERKFELDVWYVDNVSFLLDLKILGLTVWKMLTGEGLSAADHATMPEFMGSDLEETANN